MKFQLIDLLVYSWSWNISRPLENRIEEWILPGRLDGHRWGLNSQAQGLSLYLPVTPCISYSVSHSISHSVGHWVSRSHRLWARYSFSKIRPYKGKLWKVMAKYGRMWLVWPGYEKQCKALQKYGHSCKGGVWLGLYKAIWMTVLIIHTVDFISWYSGSIPLKLRLISQIITRRETGARGNYIFLQVIRCFKKITHSMYQIISINKQISNIRYRVSGNKSGIVIVLFLNLCTT